MDGKKDHKKKIIEIVDKPTYRANEAAVYASVGLSTIWLYAKQGKITPLKISDRVTVFKKEDLDNLIAGV